MPVAVRGSLLDRWNRYWFQGGRPEPLAAFRILYGIYLLGYFGSFARKLFVVFSTNGVVQPWILPHSAIPTPAVAATLYALWMSFAMAFTLGYRTRWTTPLLLLFYGYFYLLNLAVKDTAYDRLNLILIATACFGNLDSIWAVRPTHPVTAITDFPINTWVVRILRLQMCFLYFGAGLWKFSAPAWQGHEMMRWTLAGAWGTPLAFWLVGLGLPNVFYAGLGWSVIVFELIAPFTLSFYSTVKPTVIAGAAFHVGVALLLNIPEFFNCLTIYALFWPVEELAACGKRIHASLTTRRLHGGCFRPN